MLYEVYSVVRERKQAELEATRREVVVMNAEPHAPIRIKTKAHIDIDIYIVICRGEKGATAVTTAACPSIRPSRLKPPMIGPGKYKCYGRTHSSNPNQIG
ncbi:unnamed protein product [Laminaria digitata]